MRRSREQAGQVVWYSHLFENFPEFIVIHTVKGFGVVNKVEVDVFLELLCFFDDSTDVGSLISGSSAFSKSSLNIWNFMVHILLPEARRGSQGASRAAPGKSGLHARGEGERVLALESREGTRASRRVEEGLSRSLSGGGGKPSFPSPSAGTLGNFPGCL